MYERLFREVVRLAAGGLDVAERSHGGHRLHEANPASNNRPQSGEGWLLDVLDGRAWGALPAHCLQSESPQRDTKWQVTKNERYMSAILIWRPHSM
jgi:hypothetical protein